MGRRERLRRVASRPSAARERGRGWARVRSTRSGKASQLQRELRMELHPLDAGGGARLGSRGLRRVEPEPQREGVQHPRRSTSGTVLREQPARPDRWSARSASVLLPPPEGRITATRAATCRQPEPVQTQRARAVKVLADRETTKW